MQKQRGKATTKNPNRVDGKRRWVPNGSATPTQCWTTVPRCVLPLCVVVVQVVGATCRSTMDAPRGG